MNLNRLFLVHAVVTFAAGVVLLVAPAVIPGTVGIQLNPNAYLLCYLLGAAEISLAVLSYLGRELADRQGRRLVCLAFIVFHSLTALAEIYAFTDGVSLAIWANVAVRVLVISLFFYYGLIKTTYQNINHA